MKRLIALVLSLVLICSLFCGCNNKDNIATPDSANNDVYMDSSGRKVAIPKNITKIAASGSNAERLLYPIASDLLVGISDNIDKERQKYFDKSYVELPVLGQFYSNKGTLNIEELIKLSPDIIIDMGDRKDSTDKDMDEIQRKTGIPTIFIEASLGSYSSAYRTLGKILNREEKAKNLCEFIDNVMNLAKENKKAVKENPVTMLYTTGPDGLSANAKGSVQAAVLDTIGIENCLEVNKISNKSGGNLIDMEQVQKMNPAYIVFDNAGGYEKSNSDSVWKSLKAVQEKHNYEIPCMPYNILGNPPSINQIIGILWLGNLVYPDLYDFDIEYEMGAFYHLFYHYELSEEETKELLKNSTWKE